MVKPEEYRSKTIEELKQMIEDINLDIATSYGSHDVKKVRPEHRKNFRKEIARIKTILQERRDDRSQ